MRDAFVTDRDLPDIAYDDVTFADTGQCLADDTPPIEGCGAFEHLGCQEWAESTLPGWDVVTTVYCGGGTSTTCVRGEGPVMIDAGPGNDAGGAWEFFDGGPGFDAGDLSAFRCGDGPACSPGFQCARRLGFTNLPRTCVCTNPS
jgi:hypothetical protein